MSQNASEKIKQILSDNLSFVIIMVITYLVSAYFVIVNPKGPHINELKSTFFLFGPSIASFMLLLIIGIFLVKRYYQRPSPRAEVRYQLFWGLSFLIFALTFLGLCLQAWGWEHADMNEEHLFMIWRSPMILWVAGMWIGSIMLLTKDKRIIYYPAIIIIVFGELWFYYGLMVEKDIEKTMYGFLFWEFIPMAITLAYVWYRTGKDLDLTSPYVLASGFILMAFSYISWAPWHFTPPAVDESLSYIYFIWFNIFVVSLSLIFAGFYGLGKEVK